MQPRHPSRFYIYGCYYYLKKEYYVLLLKRSIKGSNGKNKNKEKIEKFHIFPGDTSTTKRPSIPSKIATTSQIMIFKIGTFPKYVRRISYMAVGKKTKKHKIQDAKENSRDSMLKAEEKKLFGGKRFA